MNDTSTSQKQDLTAELSRGIAVSMDPVNDLAIQTGGKATTTLNSHWLHQRCPACSHSFRLGDRVEINAETGVILHNSTLLPCAQGLNLDPMASPVTTDFFVGLDEAWPAPPDIQTRRLEAGESLLKPPSNGFQRHTCFVCGHTFRLHDHVVICPCSPNQPRCEIAVHRDLIHGLHCFDAWNPRANKQRYCPVTLKELPTT
jgi:hypothetical protein